MPSTTAHAGTATGTAARVWLGRPTPAAEALHDQAKPEREAEELHQATQNRHLRHQMQRNQTDHQGSQDRHRLATTHPPRQFRTDDQARAGQAGMTATAYSAATARSCLSKALGATRLVDESSES